VKPVDLASLPWWLVGAFLVSIIAIVAIVALRGGEIKVPFANIKFPTPRRRGRR
jgi:hypothetical protein